MTKRQRRSYVAPKKYRVIISDFSITERSDEYVIKFVVNIPQLSIKTDGIVYCMLDGQNVNGLLLDDYVFNNHDLDDYFCDEMEDILDEQLQYILDGDTEIEWDFIVPSSYNT